MDIKFLCDNNCFLPHICFSGTGQLGNTDVAPFFCSLLQSPSCSLQNSCVLHYLLFLNSTTVPLQFSGSYSMVAPYLACALGMDLLKSSAKNLNIPTSTDTSIKWLLPPAVLSSLRLRTAFHTAHVKLECQVGCRRVMSIRSYLPHLNGTMLDQEMQEVALQFHVFHSPYC